MVIRISIFFAVLGFAIATKASFLQDFPKDLVVSQEYSTAEDAQFHQTADEKIDFWIHSFRGPVVGQDYPRGLEISGYLISRSVKTDKGLVVDEIWRRPMEHMHIRVHRDGAHARSRLSTVLWVEKQSTLYLAYSLSTPTQSMILVDELILDQTDDEDWTVTRIATQNQHFATDLAGAIPETLKMQRKSDGSIVLTLVAGKLSKEVSFSSLSELELSRVAVDPRYKSLQSIVGLFDSVDDLIRK